MFLSGMGVMFCLIDIRHDMSKKLRHASGRHGATLSPCLSNYLKVNFFLSYITDCGNIMWLTLEIKCPVYGEEM